jgi:predicted outer membrane repeat protein
MRIYKRILSENEIRLLHLEDAIRVPADYLTIQAAVDAADDGDTIILSPGTYTGSGNHDIDFNGKEVTLLSENGPDTCIIDCQDNGRGFSFTNNEDEDTVISGITVINGYYTSSGGGMICSSASPLIVNCVFRDCGSSLGGAVNCSNGSHPTFERCVIHQNQAAWGGGLYCDNSSPYLKGCTITDNTTKPGNGMGGGIYCRNSSNPVIHNCQFANNSTNYHGGAIYIRDSAADIVNCIINGNDARYAGGIYISNCNPVTITNCTIYGNITWTVFQAGIQSYSSTTAITNCILWNNDNGPLIPVSGGSGVTATYSDIMGGYPGTGNINSDPLFVNASAGDFHLTSTSPCINAGTTTNAPEDDIDGDQRPIGSGIDIGVDEVNSI